MRGTQRYPIILIGAWDAPYPLPAEASRPVMPAIRVYPYLINNPCRYFIEALPQILAYMMIYL